MPSNRKYAHRPAFAGLYESICLRCFRTIGQAASEENLAESEARHVCSMEDVIALHGPIPPEKSASPLSEEESA